MSKPNWRTAGETPEFGEKIFAEDDWGKYMVLKAIEGDDWDGVIQVSYIDEDESLVDDIEIIRWVPLREILGEEK